jgi:hypothetical protein
MNRTDAPIRFHSAELIVTQTRSVIESSRLDLHRLNAALAQFNGTYKESLALIAHHRRTPPNLSHSIGVGAGMEDRNHLEQQLALAEEHLIKVTGFIARQRELVEKVELDHAGLATSAKALLAQYEEFHAMLASERVRLFQELHPENRTKHGRAKAS